MRVSQCVYIVNGGYFGNLGNAYAIKGRESVLLIDTGMRDAMDTILGNLEYWGMGNIPIEQVLCTHGHRDHTGGARFLQERGAKIVCGEGDAWQMREGGLKPDAYPALDFDMEPCEPDRLVNDGDVIMFDGREIRVIGAPGHSDGSVVFEFIDGPKKIFFTGDTVICDGELGEEIILGWPGDPNYNSAMYVKTLHKLFKYEPDYVLGGHGIPCLSDGNRVLRNACFKAMKELR